MKDIAIDRPLSARSVRRVGFLMVKGHGGTASLRMGRDSSVLYRTAEMSNSEQHGVSAIAAWNAISK